MAIKRDVGRITALYERLSRDDDQSGDSLSISNQKKYLEDYAMKNGFRNIRHYTDDGFTGRNFNRPGFQSLLQDIENDLISTVIVKDMSRFGRNYLQVGFYTEIMFPKKSVRFIAINNNVDSNSPVENDFAPFLNIMNEWYAKDTSNKIKTIFLSRMKEGKRCSGSIPYGYNRLSGDKQTLVIDPVTSEVVRRIFHLAADDMGPTEIARQLSAEKILIPSAYTRRFHPEQCNMRHIKDEYKWHPTTITGILQRQEYLGHTVLRKSIGTDFKTDTRRVAEEDEQFVFLNTHEPIIDQNTWDRVRNSYVRRPKKYKPGAFSEQNRYEGLLFCADCGSRMVLQVHYNKNGEPILTYRCSGYKRRWGAEKSCTMHHISMKDLDVIIGQAIRRVLYYALQDESAFAERLAEKWKEQDDIELKKKKDELKRNERRFSELNNQIQTLYQDYSRGLLPERQYRALIGAYDEEQNRIEIRNTELTAAIDAEEKKPTDTKRFLDVIRKYRDLSYAFVDKRLLKDLIDRIVIHEATGGKTKARSVAIDVYFNFIGECSFEPIPDELREGEEEKKRREIEKQEIAETRKEEKRKKDQEEKEKRQIHKICESCGKEFVTLKTRQKNCSPECSKKAKNRRSIEYHREKKNEQLLLNDGHPYPKRNCIVCGKPFWPVNSKNTICSRECVNKKQLEKYYRRKAIRNQESNNS